MQTMTLWHVQLPGRVACRRSSASADVCARTQGTRHARRRAQGGPQPLAFSVQSLQCFIKSMPDHDHERTDPMC